MRSAVRALAGTARSMDWAPLAAAAASVAGLILAQRPWDGHELSLVVARAIAAVVAIGAALVLDDAAAVTLTCSPTSLLWRRVVRLALAGVVAVGVTVVAVVVVGVVAGTGRVPLGRFVVEGVALLLLAMALSVWFGGDRGAFLFAAALLGAVVVQQQWPAWSLFPMAPGAPGWTGAVAAWMATAMISLGGLFLLSRDPQRV